MTINNNADRADRAERAVVWYDGTDNEYHADSREAVEQVMSDLVADLRHLADRHDLPWQSVLDRAATHYIEEVAEEAEFDPDERTDAGGEFGGEFGLRREGESPAEWIERNEKARANPESVMPTKRDGENEVAYMARYQRWANRNKPESVTKP